MKSLYFDSIENLKVNLEVFEKNDKIKSILIFLADNSSISKSELSSIIINIKTRIIGGIFPEIIYQNKKFDNAGLLIPLDYDINAFKVSLSEDINFDKFLLEKLDEKAIDENGIFVFVDAFAKRKNDFIHSLFNVFGLSATYLGGGAGSLSFKQFPCVIDNNGIYENAAVIGLFKKEFKIGVAHGWSEISEPMKITESLGTQVISIDWEPAYQVYKSFVESHSGKLFTSDNFFDIAKSYPLGLVKLDDEMVIRDPYHTDGSSLFIVDEVPEGEYVRIMHGNIDSLLNGASIAKESASNNNFIAESDVFCVDCISRVLYMGDIFEEEIEVVRGNGQLNGILSIGEIANNGGSYLEIYNKTVVVAVW